MLALCVCTTSTSDWPSREGCSPQRPVSWFQENRGIGRRRRLVWPAEVPALFQLRACFCAAGSIQSHAQTQDHRLHPTQPSVIGCHLTIKSVCASLLLCVLPKHNWQFERYKLSSKNQEENWPLSKWPRGVTGQDQELTTNRAI